MTASAQVSISRLFIIIVATTPDIVVKVFRVKIPPVGLVQTRTLSIGVIMI